MRVGGGGREEGKGIESTALPLLLFLGCPSSLDPQTFPATPYPPPRLSPSSAPKRATPATTAPSSPRPSPTARAWGAGPPTRRPRCGRRTSWRGAPRPTRSWASGRARSGPTYPCFFRAGARTARDGERDRERERERGRRGGGSDRRMILVFSGFDRLNLAFSLLHLFPHTPHHPLPQVRRARPPPALHRLLHLLPQGGGLPRPGHAGHLPRAPV